MTLPSLIPGTLIRRYKRFLADIRLESGEEITAHVANPGAMTGLAEAGARVWLSKSDNPKRKLAYSWEIVEVGDARGALDRVCVNTGRANGVVAAALDANTIPELMGWPVVQREVKYGQNSRIDFLLTSGVGPDCYVEVKSVTLRRAGRLAEFPDAKTARGAKHLAELANMRESGARAVMLYVVMHEGCDSFRLAQDIDPAYAAAFEIAQAAGVEALVYRAKIPDPALGPSDITLGARLPMLAG